MPTDESKEIQWFTILDKHKAVSINSEELLARFRTKYSPYESFQEMFCFDRGMTVGGSIGLFSSLVDVSNAAGVLIADMDNSDPLLWYETEKKNVFRTLCIITFIPNQIQKHRNTN